MSVASDLPKCAGGEAALKKNCGRGHACEHEQGPLFDTKFGADFLAGVPTEPGVYRFYDVEGALLYSLALKHAKVPFEVHVYPKGGHGYGLRHSPNLVSQWPQRAEGWLTTQGWLKPRK